MVGLCRLIAVFLVLVAAVSSQVPPQQITSGRQAADSLKFYESILETHPDLVEAKYDAGRQAYRLGDFNRAHSEFKEALESNDERFTSKVLYNFGNALLKEAQAAEMQGVSQEGASGNQQLLEMSLDAFRRSLELNSDDANAKYNYELVLRKLKEEQSQNPRGQSGQESGEDRESQDQHSKQKESEQPGSPDEADNKQPSQEKQETDQVPEQQQSSEQEQDKMDHVKRNAEAILNALKADEKTLVRRKLGQARGVHPEKDW